MSTNFIGTCLNCRIFKKGAGTPYVFLHGFLGSAEDWTKVISCMEGKTCLAYDLPGHGCVDWIDMDIDDLMPSALPPEPVHLVGYSLGGRLAMRYAIKNPARIQSLTLISTHYGLKTEEEREQRLQQDRIWAQKILIFPFDRFLNEWYDQSVFSSLKSNELMRQEILSLRQNPRPTHLYQAFLAWSLGRQPCYAELLKAMPCRVLCGELDEKYVSLYQGWSQLQIVPNVGHCIHLEAPNPLAEILCHEPAIVRA